MTGTGFDPGSALAQLICARDADALGGLFDRCGGYLFEYCTLLCGTDRADDAMLAALTEFLARVSAETRDGDLDLQLVKSLRGSVAARLAATEPALPCRAIPELLAAAANGELRHGDHALAAHLESCDHCRATADRLRTAEKSFDGSPHPGTASNVRDRWLELVAAQEFG